MKIEANTFLLVISFILIGVGMALEGSYRVILIIISLLILALSLIVGTIRKN